jgi:hypothetical protein
MGIIDEAKEIAYGERTNQYGSPEDSFGRIAKYWNAFMEGKTCNQYGKPDPITAGDVAIMMALLKVAREQGPSAKRDNIIAIGYLSLYGDMLQEIKDDLQQDNIGKTWKGMVFLL